MNGTAATDGAGLTPALLKLDIDGAALYQSAALSILPDLIPIAETQPANRAGIRLYGVERLRPHLAAESILGGLASEHLGPGCRPVRAILFDKSAATNWSLGWHQDRTIVVRDRIDTPGFGPWTLKSGLVHVAPPAYLLAGMMTMRVHLDAVPPTNAPLLIAPGSHRLGRIPEIEIDHAVARCGTATCLAEAGDVWLYATPILHASAASTNSTGRRVLQIDFAAVDLPNGLAWMGV